MDNSLPYVFHISLLSSVIPRNLMLFVLRSEKSFTFTCKFIIFLWFVTNCINWVFFRFSVRKLFLHQFSMTLITRFKEFSKLFTLEIDIMALVSSANGIGVAYFFINVARSLIKIRNKRRPRTDPWGTPCLTNSQEEVVFISYHYLK